MARKPHHLAGIALLVAACLLTSGCTGAYLWAINREAPPRDQVDSRTFDAGHALAVDVYHPAASATPAPVIVFFHGGSWQNGNRHGYRFVGAALARGGALALVPDYRKAPRHHFPTFMTDAARAVAWAREHAAELGGDPSRIYVMGHSAGAHIAVLLAADARYLDAVGMRPKDLRGVVALSGPYDFLPTDEPLLEVVFGKGPLWRDAQPLDFIDGDEPPFLVMHGEADAFVEPSDSVQLAHRLERSQGTVELQLVPGVGHVAMINGFRSPRHSPALARTLRYVGLPDDAVRRNTTLAGSGGGSGRIATGRGVAGNLPNR